MSGAVIAGIAAPILQGVIGSILNRGNSKAQDQAIGTQLQLAKQLVDIFTQQAKQDIPFRRDTFQALRDRAAQRSPTITPRGAQAVNPLARARQVGIPQTTSLPVPVSQAFGPQPGQTVNEPRFAKALQGVFQKPQEEGGFQGSLEQFFQFADRTQNQPNPLAALAARTANA